MLHQNQNFQPRLIIADHFDEIITQIDVKTETLLENQIFTEETRNEINEMRQRQVDKLKQLKELNLNHLPKQINEEKFREKWSHVIDDNSLEYKHKIDKIKEDLILDDCVLLENPNRINGVDLWITSWYYNIESWTFLK
jgi:hypothetical protein